MLPIFVLGKSLLRTLAAWVEAMFGDGGRLTIDKGHRKKQRDNEADGES